MRITSLKWSPVRLLTPGGVKVTPQRAGNYKLGLRNTKGGVRWLYTGISKRLQTRLSQHLSSSHVKELKKALKNPKKTVVFSVCVASSRTLAAKREQKILDDNNKMLCEIGWNQRGCGSPKKTNKKPCCSGCKKKGAAPKTNKKPKKKKPVTKKITKTHSKCGCGTTFHRRWGKTNQPGRSFSSCPSCRR
jgi:predicted GIY-YIG superfamily endonuclease